MYLGIDPGLEKSAFVLSEMYNPLSCGICHNEDMVEMLIANGAKAVAKMIIEIPICRKWSGADISNTAIWAGRFVQAWPFHQTTRQISRSKVRGVLGCHRGGDKAVRDALIERFDPDNFTKTKAGVYRDNGSEWFKGFKEDIWQAYATIVAHLDDMKRG